MYVCTYIHMYAFKQLQFCNCLARKLVFSKIALKQEKYINVLMRISLDLAKLQLAENNTLRKSNLFLE